MTNILQVDYGSGHTATPANTVYYTVKDVDGNILVERSNVGTTVVLDKSNNPTGSFSVQLNGWNPNWSGTIVWDINTTNIQTITYITSPSYSSILDASIYFKTRLYSNIWFCASLLTQQNALNDATRILNKLSWQAYVTLSKQVHCWPRAGIYMNLIAIDDQTIPKDILDAQYEIALALLKGYDPERDARGSAVTSRGYSSVRTAYDPSFIPDYIRYGIPSLAAWNLILTYVDMNIAETIRLHRVT